MEILKQTARIRNETRIKKLGFVIGKSGDSARIRNEKQARRLDTGLVTCYNFFDSIL